MAKGRKMPMGMPGGGKYEQYDETGSNAKTNGRHAKKNLNKEK